jgi:Mrp family chromosome partitioning ATPase
VIDLPTEEQHLVELPDALTPKTEAPIAPAEGVGRAGKQADAMKIIAVTNIKGGVGKTTTAVNLSYLCAASTGPTLLWDLDAQGAATYTLARRSLRTGNPEEIAER